MEITREVLVWYYCYSLFNKFNIRECQITKIVLKIKKNELWFNTNCIFDIISVDKFGKAQKNYFQNYFSLLVIVTFWWCTWDPMVNSNGNLLFWQFKTKMTWSWFFFVFQYISKLTIINWHSERRQLQITQVSWALVITSLLSAVNFIVLALNLYLDDFFSEVLEYFATKTIQKLFLTQNFGDQKWY